MFIFYFSFNFSGTQVPYEYPQGCSNRRPTRLRTSRRPTRTSPVPDVASPTLENYVAVIILRPRRGKNIPQPSDRPIPPPRPISAVRSRGRPRRRPRGRCGRPHVDPTAKMRPCWHIAGRRMWAALLGRRIPRPSPWPTAGTASGTAAGSDGPDRPRRRPSGTARSARPTAGRPIRGRPRGRPRGRQRRRPRDRTARGSHGRPGRAVRSGGRLRGRPRGRPLDRTALAADHGRRGGPSDPAAVRVGDRGETRPSAWPTACRRGRPRRRPRRSDGHAAPSPDAAVRSDGRRLRAESRPIGRPRGP